VPRVKVGMAAPSRRTVESEIAEWRDFDAGALRKRWHVVFGRPAPSHLPRHLLFRMMAYRIQADRFGDLDNETRRLLDGVESPEQVAEQAAKRREHKNALRPGTMLGREWNGQMHRVAVLAEGFAWNGKTYASLSTIASAITGTRWNGPRFFGLRDKAPEARS
jgi:hypothetical protein